ncbi:hypothetical protein JTE90_011669 [Oedothorax gibbosus]|uniref:Uncharacterized protein n=1 Tax=Oedothorax gibbosus TaxID=931172 RepID=A0AAV6USK8_9ARAC|nr:hypothetical protein JTE90_011669 [Oedothorax gibbosus]
MAPTREYESSNDKFPMHYAARNGYILDIHELFDKGMSLNIRDSNNLTPLHYAAINGHLNVAKSLVAKNCDINIKAPDGSTSLLLAAQKSNKDIVGLLIDAGADIGGCNKQKWTLLHFACHKGWRDIVKTIVANKNNNFIRCKDIDVNVVKSKGTNDNVVRSKNIDVNVIKSKDTNDNVVRSKNIDVIVAKSKDINISTNKVIDVFIGTEKRNCSTNKTKNGAISKAINGVINKAENGATCESINGATCESINGATSKAINGATSKAMNGATSKAINGATSKAINGATSKDIDINAAMSRAIDIKIAASKAIDVTVARSKNIVLSKMININAVTSKGDTPLSLAVEKRHKEIVQLLVQGGADVQSPIKGDWTLLHYACCRGWTDLVKTLLDMKCDPNLKLKNGVTPAMLAADFKNMGVLNLLLEYGADKTCVSDNKWTLLHYAACRGLLEVVQTFVEDKFDIDVKTSSGSTPLLLAMDWHCMDIVQLLIDSGADVECCDMECGLLHYAAKRGNMDLVKLFVRRKLNLNVMTFNKLTPVLIAASHGQKDVVQLLVNHGADLTQYTSDGWNAFHYACRRGWVDIVKSMMNYESFNINVTTDAGETPLLLALRYRNADIVELLVQAGADIYCCDNNKWNLLHYASLVKWPPVVELIVKEKKININAKTSEGSTPLHIASYPLNRKNVELLLKAGADCNIKNNENKTPLYHSISHSSSPQVIDMFLNYGACIDSITYYKIWELTKFKDHFLRDVNLCTQAIVNKFDNEDLPKLYKIPGIREQLPSMKKLKLKHNKNIVWDIEKFVHYEIQSKGHCNVLDMRPSVLKMLSVKSIINYYHSI